MFYDDEEMYFREFIHVVHNELVHPNLEISPHGLRAIPTHTEDGIPIRKIYVTNLPPMTTRTELFGVFAQYGFIKSCWVRLGDRGPKSPTYAFVTYTNANDAHKALQAPQYEKVLRGRTLKISPADSWHQPYEDSQGKVLWRRDGKITTIQECSDIPQSECVGESSAVEPQSQVEQEPSYTILEILNRDCLNHILSYIPLRDIIRSERVSKKWRVMVFDYLEGFRTFKTSWWQHGNVMLTTAVLRRVLLRLGGSLLRLHIDHRWSALNDRTAHVIGKFCPNLEELMIAGMNTTNWNPLIYGCKNLKSLMFMYCGKLTDSSLVQLVNSESCLESLVVSHNTHVTGLFLTGSDPRRLKRIAFYNCFCLQGTVLAAAMDRVPHLTTLKLDLCPASMWKMMPEILGKLPQLEELSLTEYTSSDVSYEPDAGRAFCDAIGKLTRLRILNLSMNTFINNSVLKQVAQSCPRLQSLNVSSCNARRNFSNAGVGDEGVTAVCASCASLSRLDVSYLAALGDAGLAAAARARSLTRLVTRGNPALGDAPLAACLASCHYLQELDACGCDRVSEEVVSAAARALDARPRALVLRLAGTAAAAAADVAARDKARWPPMSHKLLTVDVTEDRSEQQLRPDYVDHVFEDSSDDSIDDMYDQENFEDFLGSDDDIFLDEDLDDYEGIYAYGPNFLVL